MTTLSAISSVHKMVRRAAPQRLGALLVLAAASGPSLAQAQTANGSASVGSVGSVANPTFVIRGFDIEGDNPLPQAETTRILAPFLRTDASIETLQRATAALEAALKARGHGLHRVALPPQEVGNKVTLNVVRFVIGKVKVEGLSRLSEANIRASLPALAQGGSPNLHQLAIQTAMANENDGKNVQVSLKESDEADRIDATILVKEARPWSLSSSLSNTGSAATGRDRLTVAGGHSNLFDLDHQALAAYTTSIARSQDVKQLGLNYRMPLYRLGAMVTASYTRSDVVGNFGTFTSTGAGQTVGVNYTKYLQPQVGRRSYLTAALDDKRFDPARISGSADVQAMRRSRPLTLGYSARVETDAAAWSYNLDLAINLPGGRGNEIQAYQSEDPRVLTTRWKAVRGAGSYVTGFGAGWLGSIRGQYQYSATPLIAGEQFGLGGAASVRGTAERPISGDSGAMAAVELSTPELAAGLRLVGFVDAGWLANHSPNDSKPSSDRLASTGIGLRYASSVYGISADWARVMRGSVVPYTTGSGLPQSGDQKLHINISARF